MDSRELKKRIYGHEFLLIRSTFSLHAVQINGLRARYPRQISGIAIEGHRTRKSSSSPSSSKISSRVADESLRGRTHLRTYVSARTNYEPYATRAYVRFARESRVLPRVICVHLRAPICARLPGACRDSIVPCVSVAKLQIEHLPSRSRVRAVKILGFFIVTSSVTSAKYGY